MSDTGTRPRHLSLSNPLHPICCSPSLWPCANIPCPAYAVGIFRKGINHKIYQLIGNGFLETSNFELACNKYTKVLSGDQSNSFLNLLMAASYLQATKVRTTQNKSDIAAQAATYMNYYKQFRGVYKQIEIYYNLGRFYSFLNLNIQAQNFYQLVVDLYLSKESKDYYEKIAPAHERQYDANLFKQSLYNLMILQKMQGNHEIAHTIIEKFLVL